MQTINRVSGIIAALCCFVLFQPARSENIEVAFVLKVTGEAQVKSSAADWSPLKKGARLHNQDQIRTGANGLVAIVFLDDKTMMKIRADSEVRIETTTTEKGLHKRVLMEMGQMWSRVVPGRGGFQLETPSSVAAVKGTEFYGMIDENGETVIIGIEGIIQLYNQLGSVLVKKGETGRAAKRSQPEVTATTEFDNWAAEDEVQELDLEYQNEAGEKKHLKIRYTK